MTYPRKPHFCLLKLLFATPFAALSPLPYKWTESGLVYFWSLRRLWPGRNFRLAHHLAARDFGLRPRECGLLEYAR